MPTGFEVVDIEEVKSAAKTDSTSDDYMFVLIDEEWKPARFFDATDDPNHRVVRRPFGLEFKKDTFAYIDVMRTLRDADGSEIAVVPLALFNENHQNRFVGVGIGGNEFVDVSTAASVGAFGDSGDAIQASTAPYTNNFLVTAMTEAREEKFQILETFGEEFVFLFGERPRFVDITGTLINSNSHHWKREWWLNYNKFLRGTKAVENQAIVRLHIDETTIGGFILSASTQEVAEQPRRLQFTFRMLVVDYLFDEPEHNFFLDNLFINRPESGAPGERGVGAVAASVAGGLESASDAVDSVLSNSIVQAAVSTITGAVFGDPVSAITDGIAASLNVFEVLGGEDLGALAEVDVFREGAGSLVEFRGKPPGLQVVDGGLFGGQTTIQELGKKRLVASVDNSLSLLLNLRRSPVIQMVGVLGGLLDAAFAAFGSTGPFASLRQGYSDLLDTNGARKGGISGRFMGLDLTLPKGTITITTVNPESHQVIPAESLTTTGFDALSREEKDLLVKEASVKGDAHEVRRLFVKTGSEVDFDELKKDPNYERLPRSWRIRIEKTPAQMSEKIIASSRKNSESDLVMLIRTNKKTLSPESTLSRQLREAVA